MPGKAPIKFSFFNDTKIKPPPENWTNENNTPKSIYNIQLKPLPETAEARSALLEQQHLRLQAQQETPTPPNASTRDDVVLANHPTPNASRFANALMNELSRKRTEKLEELCQEIRAGNTDFVLAVLSHIDENKNNILHWLVEKNGMRALQKILDFLIYDVLQNPEVSDDSREKVIDIIGQPNNNNATPLILACARNAKSTDKSVTAPIELFLGYIASIITNPFAIEIAPNLKQDAMNILGANTSEGDNFFHWIAENQNIDAIRETMSFFADLMADQHSEDREMKELAETAFEILFQRDQEGNTAFHAAYNAENGQASIHLATIITNPKIAPYWRNRVLKRLLDCDLPQSPLKSFPQMAAPIVSVLDDPTIDSPLGNAILSGFY